VSSSGASLYFEGNETAHPTVLYAAAFAPASRLTFEAWIRPTTASLTESQFITQLGINGWGVFIVAGGSATGSCTGKTTNTIGYFQTSCESSTFSNTTVDVDEWTHVAVTVNTNLTSNQVRIYLNGQDKTDTVTSPDTGAVIGDGGGSTALKIGAAGGCACALYAGYIDEIRIWNSAVSAATISQWMSWELGANSTWHPDWSSLVLHLALDDDITGTVAADNAAKSGARYNATVPASAWSTLQRAELTITPYASPPPSPPPSPVRVFMETVRPRGIIVRCALTRLLNAITVLGDEEKGLGYTSTTRRQPKSRRSLHHGPLRDLTRMYQTLHPVC
jgi:hypothetical protein